MPNKELKSCSPPAAKKSAKLGQKKTVSANISHFHSCLEKTASKKNSILGFALEVKLGTYRSAIERLRESLDQGDHIQVDKLKKSLPAVSLSGMITEGPRTKAHQQGRFQHSGYLQGDFDAKDFHPRKPNEIKATLANDQHVQAVFLSARRGVKVIISIPVCETPAEHKAAFVAAASYFRGNYGLDLDPSTKDPVRLCYASYDPDAYVNYSPASELPVVVGNNPSDKSTVPVASPADCEANVSNTAVVRDKLTPDMIKEMLACIPTRPEYDLWLKISSAVWAATEDEATGTTLLKNWSPEEDEGEYAEKFKNRLTQITAGTLVHLARKHGYKRPSGEKDNGSLHIPDDVFPIPAGEIEYKKSGGIIFNTIAPTHTVFMRGGITHEVIAYDNEPAYFAPLSPERFCSLVENYDHRVARLERQKSKGKDKCVWRKQRLPISTAKILLCSDAASRNLPRVRQLAACPVFTKEGVVLERGYHPHAGGTYITGGKTPPEMPVEAATNAILHLLNDFNFVTPADKSRAVASILSPALKMGDWLDEDFPMDVAEADQSQSGKTYRQKIVNRIYNEIPAAITAPRGGVGSLDETISAALIKGRPFITLDNFRGKLDSTILEQAIRGMKRVSCRALRISADVDTRPFNWQLSTNGADFTRDIANRSIITRIRKQSAGYRFKEYAEGDLLSHVGEKQPFYLGAVFSILKEWAREECPKTKENRHDFRGWCRSMDWIVQNIFKLAPLLDGHREEQARTANPALQWLRDVTMAARSAKQLDCALTTIQLVSIADDAGIEFPGNSLSREEPHQRAGKILGKVFRDTDGQPVTVDGLAITREEQVLRVEGRGYENKKIYTITEIAEK